MSQSSNEPTTAKTVRKKAPPALLVGGGVVAFGVLAAVALYLFAPTPKIPDVPLDDLRDILAEKLHAAKNEVQFNLPPDAGVKPGLLYVEDKALRPYTDLNVDAAIQNSDPTSYSFKASGTLDTVGSLGFQKGSLDVKAVKKVEMDFAVKDCVTSRLNQKDVENLIKLQDVQNLRGRKVFIVTKCATGAVTCSYKSIGETESSTSTKDLRNSLLLKFGQKTKLAGVMDGKVDSEGRVVPFAFQIQSVDDIEKNQNPTTLAGGTEYELKTRVLRPDELLDAINDDTSNGVR